MENPKQQNGQPQQPVVEIESERALEIALNSVVLLKRDLAELREKISILTAMNDAHEARISQLEQFLQDGGQ